MFDERYSWATQFIEIRKWWWFTLNITLSMPVCVSLCVCVCVLIWSCFDALSWQNKNIRLIENWINLETCEQMTNMGIKRKINLEFFVVSACVQITSVLFLFPPLWFNFRGITFFFFIQRINKENCTISTELNIFVFIPLLICAEIPLPPRLSPHFPFLTFSFSHLLIEKRELIKMGRIRWICLWGEICG